MKKSATLLAALAVAFAADGATVRTATEDFVTNRIAAAVAAIPSPDFTTNNAALVETIQETAPAPGNYSAVSNAAMSAAAATNDFLRNNGQAVMNGNLVMNGHILFPYFENNGMFIGAQTPGALYFQSTYPGYANRCVVLDIDRIPENDTVDIAFLHEVPTSEDITAAIRAQSLGGIWDAELEVWWTPVMRNGSLTYQATTNVNLNAEN